MLEQVVTCALWSLERSQGVQHLLRRRSRRVGQGPVSDPALELGDVLLYRGLSSDRIWAYCVGPTEPRAHSTQICPIENEGRT